MITLQNMIFANPLAYLVFPEMVNPANTGTTERAEYSGYLDIVQDGLVVKLFTGTNSIDLSEFKSLRIRVDNVTDRGSVVLGEWDFGKDMSTLIMSSMVLWYDLKRQGATNENMAVNPVLRDLSGNGHDATCYNFAWAKNSGIGMYGDRDFSNASASDKSVATVVKESNTKLRLTTTQLSSGISTYNLIAFYRFNNNTYTTEWRIKVTGLKKNQGIRLFIHNNIGVPAYVLDNNGSVDSSGIILSDGTYLIKPVLNTNTPETATAEFYATSFPFGQETAYDVTIELLPQYPNALVSDGVDDYAMVKGLPMLNKEDGYTVIVKRTHIDNNLNQYTLIAKNSTNNYTDGAFKFEQLTEGYKCSTDSFGISTRLDFSSNNIVYQQTRSYNGEKRLNAGSFEDSNFMVIFNDGGYQPKLHACTALYSLILFNRDLTPEEIAWVKQNLM